MPTQTILDKIDRRILAIIQEDARITNTQLATRVDLSASPCWRRVWALEEAGVIRRYVTVVDPEAIGLPVNVFAMDHNTVTVAVWRSTH